MSLKKDFNCASKCTRLKNGGDYHRIHESFHWSHEHPQYFCFDCGIRFTPLEKVDKSKSCIKRIIHFFRWRTHK